MKFLADFASQTIMDSSSTSDPTAATTASDQLYVSEPSIAVDPSMTACSVDPMVEQTMMEDQVMSADSMAWSSIGEENALELI